MPAIHVEGVRKAYGDVDALENLSLSIESGELYGLLGPNGAGKTTTMEILTGQTVPDGGAVSVLETDPVTDPIGVREQVGILPEKESPPSFLTPREYIEFVGAVRELPDEQVDERLETWAERLGFAETLETLSTDLSRGQQQKVMIAGAFLHEPDVVFIDEPLANLDPIVQERVKRFLLEYQSAGNTVLLSTHDVDVAAELCSRVGIVYGGELVTEVRLDDLPADRTLLEVFFDRVETDDGRDEIDEGRDGTGDGDDATDDERDETDDGHDGTDDGRDDREAIRNA